MVGPPDLIPLQLPNPFTPMAFLPPEIAYQMQTRIYVLVGMLGILAWDILVHLGEDYTLLMRYRPNIPTAVYFLSRWSALAYCVLSAVFDTAQIQDCNKLGSAVCAIYHPSVSLTSLLFFFRVRAVYAKNKWITIIFFMMWLVIVGMTATIVTRAHGTRVGNLNYCTYLGFQSYLGWSSITIGVFDTCVFVAITWRLLVDIQPSPGDDGTSKRFSRLLGKYLPRFSRALLQDGQKYYMVAMVCNLLVLITSYVHGVPDVYRPLFPAAAVGLTNIVACRVFRHTKLGYYDRLGMTCMLNPISTPSKYGPIVFASVHVGSTVYKADMHTSVEVPSTGLRLSREVLAAHGSITDSVLNGA